ncbi:uncharacterized protein LOC130731717 [Lotus japonicus]|uniref:uncharacterized protein LOC130731717 n=1 Tax=Lotus japonicus TaxID=34305 RepID=UPI00258AEC3A|nr:uncharacterized protein LOC130731717 [Lotus japonicus]
MAVVRKLLPFVKIAFIILLLGYKKTMVESAGMDVVVWAGNKDAKLQCCGYNYIGRCMPESPDVITCRNLCRQSSCGILQSGGACMFKPDGPHPYLCYCPCSP